MGKGPSAVRITSRWAGTSSTISYVYASRRPRKCATKATLEPSCTGGRVFHSTDLIFAYQLGAFSGSDAYADTSSGDRSIMTSLQTSTATRDGLSHEIGFLSNADASGRSLQRYAVASCVWRASKMAVSGPTISHCTTVNAVSISR